MLINYHELANLTTLTSTLGFVAFSMIKVLISNKDKYGLRRRGQSSISPVISVKNNSHEMIEIIDLSKNQVLDEFRVKDNTKSKKSANISHKGEHVVSLGESNEKKNCSGLHAN